MCEFYIKHGEGKKWYEVMENIPLNWQPGGIGKSSSGACC